MAAPQASSRLEMLQARFQQKQLQEKEQKLLQLYDQQQQRAYQVVQRGSAGSTGSNHSSSVSHQTISRTTTTHSSSTSQGGGKVRQMFDERRQTTVKGIDRSYPLEPLDNKPKKQVASNGHVPGKGSNATVNRHSVTVRRVARADVNSNVNGGKPVVSYHEEVTHESFGDDDEFGNENHNGRYANGDHHNANRNEVHIEEILDDDTIQRNRLMAKVHLMNFDKTMKYRVNNDLESEQFPEELMLDVPDKLLKRAPTRKISQAEARLERFKNANARKSNVSKSTTTGNSTVTRKRSEPMFPVGTSSRESLASTRITKTMNTMKIGRSEGPTRKRNKGTSSEVISKNAGPTKTLSERPKISQDTKAGIRITLKTEKIVDSAKKVDPMVYETRNVERQCKRSDSAEVQSGHRQSMKSRFNETDVKIVGKSMNLTVAKTELRTASDAQIPGSIKAGSTDGTSSVEIVEEKRKPGFSEITTVRKSNKCNESKTSCTRDINSIKTKSKHQSDIAKDVKSKIITSSPKVIGTISRESSPDTTKSIFKMRTVPNVDKSFIRIETSASARGNTPEPTKLCVSNDSIKRVKTNTERRGSVERSKHLKSDITVHSAELVKKVMQDQSIEQKLDIVEKMASKGLTKKSEKSVSPEKKTEPRRTLDKMKEKIERDSYKQISYRKRDITSVDSVTKTSDSIGNNTRKANIDKSVVSNKIRDSRRGQSLDQSRGTPRFSQKKLKYVGSDHDPKEVVDDVRIERIEGKKDVMSDGRRSKSSITRVDIEAETHQSLGHERQLSEIERMSESKTRIKTLRSRSVEKRKSVPIEIPKEISKKSPEHSTEEVSKNLVTRIESEYNRRRSIDADSTRSRINKTVKSAEAQESPNPKKSCESFIDKEMKYNLKNEEASVVLSPRKRNEIRPTSTVRRLCRNSMMEDTINLKQSGSLKKDKKIRIPKSPSKSKSSSKPSNLISRSERTKEIKTKNESSAKQTLDNVDSLIKSRKVSEIIGLRKSKETVKYFSGTKSEGTGKPLRSIELVRKTVRNQSPGVSRKLEESIIRKSGSLESAGLGSEEIKKTTKAAGESARMKSNESPKIKVSSNEQSPKSSISAEIDTDRHEILIADQSIKSEKSSVSERNSEAFSTTLKKDTQSKVGTKKMQPKTANASKTIETESDTSITQSTQDHSTFLIRRPCRKRGTILNADIYGQQEVSASKQVDYTGTRKINGNSTHDKISKYDKANALKIQRKDISERSKSPDLKRSGCKESKVTVPPTRAKLEETLISAELVRRAMDNRKQEGISGSRRNSKSNILKKVHSDEAELTPEYQEISITDQFIKTDGNRLEKRKEDTSSKKAEQKHRRTIENVKRDSVDSNKTKRTKKIVANSTIVGPRHRICSKLTRQVETNLKKQLAKPSTSYTKIIMTKERSNIRKNPIARCKSPRVETSERPSSRLSSTIEFDSAKKQPIGTPRTRKPTGNTRRIKSPETTRDNDFSKIPGKSIEKQEKLKSPQLMQRVICEQSSEHRSVSSESINMDREISEFETVPIIISKEPEEPEHKIVKKQEAIFSPSTKPRSTSKPTHSVATLSKKIAEEINQKQRAGSVSKICLKLTADKESNVIRAKSTGTIFKRPMDVKFSRSIKAAIRKPVQRPRHVNDMPKVVRLTDVPANGRASSSRQIATAARKQTVKSVEKNLPRHTQTRHVSKDSLSPEDSEPKRAPSTKTLQSIALVQSAIKKEISEITKINTTQKDSTRSVESQENFKIVEDKIAERLLANVGLKRKSRPPNLNLTIIQKSKHGESTVSEEPIERERSVSINRKISDTVKTNKVEKIEQPKIIESEAKSSSRVRILNSDKKLFQDKLINALAKTINEKTTPYIVSSPDPSRVERLYPRYPVEEKILSSSDIVRNPVEIQNNVSPIKCESTDSVESALRRFDSIGTDTDQQEIVQVDTADNHMIDIRDAQGLKPKPVSPEAKIPVKNGTTGTEQYKSVTVIKGYAKPVDNDRELPNASTREIGEQKIPEIAHVGIKKYLSKTQPIHRNVTSEKKEKTISIINSTPIEKTPESRIGKISIAALDTPLHDFKSKQRKIARARNSVELARVSMQLQNPSCRRKLFEDSDSGVETEVIRPRSVNFDKDEKIDKNLKSIDVIKGKSEISDCANRISKIPVSRIGFRTQQLPSATPLRSIEVIRKSIRNEQQDQLRKTIPDGADSRKASSSNQKSVINKTHRKMTKPVISKIAQDNRGTGRKVLKASVTQLTSTLKNSQTIRSKSKYGKAITTKGSTTSQKDLSKHTRNKIETKFQPAKPSPVFFEYCTSLTKEKNSNYNTRSSVKLPKSKETKQCIETEKNTKLSDKGLQMENSINSSPPEKELHGFKRKQIRPISIRRSTAPLFSQSDKKFKKTRSLQPNITRRQSTGSNLETVKDKSSLADSLYKETIKNKYFIKKDKNQDATSKKKILKNVSDEYRSDSLDSLNMEYKHKESSSTRHNTSDTQSSNHFENSRSVCRISQSTFAVDYRSESPDSLEAEHIYSRQTVRDESSIGLEQSADRDQSPSPDSLDETCKYYTNTRNKYRTAEQIQTSGYSSISTKITVESRTASEDSLESESKYSKSIEIKKISRECTESPQSNDKGQSTREFHETTIPHEQYLKCHGNNAKTLKQQETLTKSPAPALRILKTPSPDSALRNKVDSNSRTPAASARRSAPQSPTKSPEVAARVSAEVKNSVARASRRTPKTLTRNLDTSGNIRATPDVPKTGDSVDASDRENNTQSEKSIGERKLDGEALPSISRKNEAFALEFDAFGESTGNVPTAVKMPPARKQVPEKPSGSLKQRSPTATPYPRPVSSLSTASSSSSARGQTSAIAKGKMATKVKSKSPASDAPSSGPKASARSGGTAVSNDNLAECKICGRRFAQERITLHEQICAKTGQKKRKQFDAMMFRIKGTDLEPFVRKGTSKKTESKNKKPEVKSNWRKKHEDFINAIRSAKQVQAHLAAGGKLSDLPPPPVSDTSDYIQCPHCGRKFNQSAAERHIPKCQTMLHNKPNPRAPPKPKR